MWMYLLAHVEVKLLFVDRSVKYKGRQWRSLLRHEFDSRLGFVDFSLI
jgi:hypothetical protein